MKFISNSTVPAPEGGCHPRGTIRWFFTPPTRKRIGYFGAVRLREGKLLFARAANRFDARTTRNFLCQWRPCSRRAGRRVGVITDQAKYPHAKLHAAWRAAQEPEFVLSYWPPNSPDLNPIDRVWKRTRRLCLHKRYFPTLAGVVEGVEGQFGYWQQPKESLRKLGTVT